MSSQISRQLPHCPRCAGLLAPDEYGDHYCVACGQAVYGAHDQYLAQLVDRVRRQESRGRPA